MPSYLAPFHKALPHVNPRGVYFILLFNEWFYLSESIFAEQLQIIRTRFQVQHRQLNGLSSQIFGGYLLLVNGLPLRVENADLQRPFHRVAPSWWRSKLHVQRLLNGYGIQLNTRCSLRRGRTLTYDREMNRVGFRANSSPLPYRISNNRRPLAPFG